MARPEVFARRIRRIAESVPVNASRILQKAVVRAGSNVVKLTPVGGPPTSPHDPHPGLARSNWVASLNAPDLGERSVRSEGSTINEIEAVAKMAPHDSEVHIANGGPKVPYLGLLNNGYSTQAPANFVRLALIMAREGLFDGESLIRVRRG